MPVVYILAVACITLVIQGCCLTMTLRASQSTNQPAHDLHRAAPIVWQVAGVALGIWFLLGLGPYLLWLEGQNALGNTNAFQPNNLGDTFGMVTSLFTALAMVGAITAVYLQRTELDMGRKAARVSALTSLMEMELHMMNDSVGGECTRHKTAALTLHGQIMELLAEMGHPMTHVPHVIISPIEQGLRQVRNEWILAHDVFVSDVVDVFESGIPREQEMLQPAVDALTTLLNKLATLARHYEDGTDSHYINARFKITSLRHLIYKNLPDEIPWIRQHVDDVHAAITTLSPPEPLNALDQKGSRNPN